MAYKKIWRIFAFFIVLNHLIVAQEKSGVTPVAAPPASASVQTNKPLSLINKQDQLIPADMPVSRPEVLPTRSEYLINFSYINADLMDIVHDIETAKNINIIPPKMGDKPEGKVTISLDHKVTIDEAWNLLNTILAIAGYSIVLYDGMHQLVKDSKNITHEPVPLFIETPLDQLPESGRIRYLTYLSNIKISEEPRSELVDILDQLLPKADNAPENRPFKIDAATNALLLMAPAADVKSVMYIVNQLDKPGFQERLEIIRLRHAGANEVARLFESIIGTGGTGRYHLDTQKPEETYFMRSTRIIPEPRTNTIIVVGKPQALERIKDFVHTYIDIEPDSGKSILHVYKLQYLQAEAFAPVLDRIVKSEQPGTTPLQASLQRGVAIGPERFFEEVIIKADTPPGLQQPATTDTAKGKTPTPYYGGNKLIIAARNDDWKRIKKLIEQLDIPKPTVLLEVLIADLTIDDQRLLGSIFRNPAKIPFVNQAAFQSAQTGPGVIPDLWATPQTIGFNENADGTTIASDLLRGTAFNADGTRAFDDAGTNNIASFITPGGTALSFNDPNGKTFAMAQLVQLFGFDKIISNPHVIASDNTTAEVRVGQERLVPDTGSGGVGGTIRKNAILKADLTVVITPRISAAGTVNLQVAVDINNFVPTAANDPIPVTQVRHLATNANVLNGGILALGGLVKVSEAEGINKTPILGDVPVFGWFAKQRTGNVTKNSLTVFICPTIIEPNFRGGASEYTKDYLALAENYAHQGKLFDSLRDPITRWFFKPDQMSEDIVHQYLSKDELKPDDLYEDKDYKTKRKEQIKEALQKEPVMVNIDKKELNNQIKEKIASTDNPMKKITRDQGSKAVGPRL